MASIPQKIAKGAFSRLIKKQEEPTTEKIKDPTKLLGETKSKWVFKIEKPGGLEETYFWLLNFLRNQLKYEINKTSDVFSATETSSYFGDLGTRKSQLQEKAAQYLGTIANMTKSLFQIVRELRIIDERLTYYNESKKQWSKNKEQREEGEAAEIALKSIWVDMVEGGAKNPNSVTSLSMQVGFVTLPDFFYKISAKSTKDVDKRVDSLKKEGINRKVREILKRKLFQYYTWKEKTEKEIQTRRNFVLKYLRQHYATMKVYINWLKPYLRHINKLEMASFSTPDLVTAFESAQIEIELLAVKKEFVAETPRGNIKAEFKKLAPCIRLKFKYVTIPQMSFQQGYQRGAIHAGRMEITMESFISKIENIRKYEKLREEEDFEIIKSLEVSMMSLGDELKRYLEEAGEVFEEKKPEQKKESVLDPFLGIFKGFKEILPIPEKRERKKKVEKEFIAQEEEKAKKVTEELFRLYHIYKKAHKMLSW